ncbi:MAG: FHA domain-containing protein [Cyanobacteriota bacterium]
MIYQLLIYLDEVQPPIVYDLNLAIYTIGRSSSCSILVLNPYVSRWHCTLVLMPPDKSSLIPYYSIMDGLLTTGSKSTGGTWVNNSRVNSAQLEHKDVVTFGSRSYPQALFITNDLKEGEGDTSSY